MQGTFLRNLGLVLVLNLFVKPFYILGIDAGVQERVGAEVFGSYAALLSLSFLLNILLDLGITNQNTRHLAQHPHLLREQFSGILGVRLVLVVLYAVVCLFAGVLLGYGAGQLHLLGWLITNQALAATLLFLRSNLAALQRYSQDSLLSVLDRALLIGLALGLGDVFLNRRALLCGRDLQRQRVLWRYHHERRAPKRVWAGGKHANRRETGDGRRLSVLGLPSSV